MRSLSLWLMVAFFIVGINSASAGAHGLDRRQEDLKPEATAEATRPRSEDNSIQTEKETATLTTSASEATITEASTTTDPITTQTAESDKTTSEPIKPSSTSTDGPHDEIDPDRLPLEPKISPAFAIAGVVLILTGVVYMLIGIKKRWAQVFLSTAFLAALSITVLVVYVMNTPVPDTRQGGYFVACFLTGAIFGGLSLVFQEITEGMGCLLGGFCLSMWLLALKPGGLLPETTSKVLFISAFTVCTYALSFSHYTRPYGLIGSTSFGGATVTVLGIDCFSRAGLKEFWLYIWGLNPDIFPLNTTTYPITRGIRVELACIVVACFIGIISQVKLWKVIRERRKAKLAAKADEEQQRDREEEEAGRILEEAKSRDKAVWEATYEDTPDKQRADSGIGRDDSAIGKEDIDRSSCVSRTEDVARETPGEDTTEKKLANRTSKRSSIWGFSKRKSSVSGNQDGVEVSSEDGTCEVHEGSQDVRGTSTSNRMSNLSTAASVDLNTVPQSPGGSRQLPIPDEGQVLPSTQSSGNMSPAPSVIPLPFTLPFHSTHKTEEEDDLSVAASAGSDIDMNEFSRRFSRLSDFTRLSGLSSGSSPAGAAEGSMTSAANRGRPPSGAVVIDSPDPNHDELTLGEDGYELTTNPNSLDDQYEIPAAPQDFISAVAQGPEKTESRKKDDKAHRSSLNINLGDEKLERQSSSSNPLPSPMLTAPGSGSWIKSRHSADSTEKTLEESSASPGGLGTSGSATKPATSRANSLTAGAVEMLPSHASSVTMSYRTNEWAKHLSRADIPSTDPIQQPKLQEEANDTSLREEPVIPVDVVQLQQTALDANPPPAIEHHPVAIARSEDSNPTGPALTVSGTSLEESPQSDMPIQSPASRKHLRPTSQYMHSKGYSILDGSSSHNGRRNSSAPFVTNSVHGSVIQETNEWESSSNREGSSSPIPPLMALRDSMIRNRMPSSFVKRNSSAPTLSKYPQTLMDASAGAHRESRAPSVAIPDDDMPLSQRRELIRQHSLNQGDPSTFSYPNSIHSHDYSRSGARTPLSPSYRQVSNPEIQRETNLAVWRESVREEMAMEHAPQTMVESRRADMLMEKRESIRGKHQETMMAHYRDQVLSEGMQRGDMQHLHREALRKMQAQANERT